MAQVALELVCVTIAKIQITHFIFVAGDVRLQQH